MVYQDFDNKRLFFKSQRRENREGNFGFGKFFGLGAKAFFIPELFIIRMPIDRKVMHLNSNAGGAEFFKNFLSSAGQFSGKPDGIQVPAGFRARSFAGKNQIGNVFKRFPIPPRNFSPLFYEAA